MNLQLTQAWIAAALTAAIAFITYLKCRGEARHAGNSNKEFFLAGGGLSWLYIAGSITITNLSTDQLLGMNGNQMALLAWWELSGVVGLSILAWVFLPIYYRNDCTTVTELLEKKYGDKNVRAVIAAMFLFGNIAVFQPIVLYSGALMMKSMFALPIPTVLLAAIFGVAGSLYAIFGGLRAAAVVDTYSGILLLFMAMLVVFLSLAAIHWDFSGIPPERISMIGGPDSPIPWPTLLTGMIFIQTFYWSTNQTITQRAMAAPNLREAQKGVVAATVIRLLVVPAIVVIPGVVSYKLFGHLGDAAYGKIVWHVLPNWLSGIFAAAIASAVLAHFTSLLNSSAALYVCDIHEKFVNPNPNVAKLNLWSIVGFVILAIAIVPFYDGAPSIINLVQQLNGLISMPVLSVFVVALLFRGVDPRAAISGMLFGLALYGFSTFVWSPLHYIHMMAVTLFASVGVALAVNRLVLGGRATLLIGSARRARAAA
ncbi:SLC5 family protein [Sphingomonas sp. AAP5]|uniref:Solute:sodium symporter family transporter n=1 Tax=Sphingomonas glacialis TaxID=658225 RepID=A0ABQ3LI98_9SPHN|nr:MULTISPECIES: SLC5 family protein [Sphingomonas]QBM74397.1 SLC5 family protein [Sphingomonas sp. AAP5]GHH15059.1 solute:sodium symporter family transporter [Sphingomonas glacialis]